MARKVRLGHCRRYCCYWRMWRRGGAWQRTSGERLEDPLKKNDDPKRVGNNANPPPSNCHQPLQVRTGAQTRVGNFGRNPLATRIPSPYAYPQLVGRFGIRADPRTDQLDGGGTLCMTVHEKKRAIASKPGRCGCDSLVCSCRADLILGVFSFLRFSLPANYPTVKTKKLKR